MNTLDLYYHLRPLIPRPLQIAIRRYVARAKRPSVGNCWPILESAAQPPAGWQGWPDGKQFALVLTHDVERQIGHDKCRQLMDLEESLGFRSSFNLVPERYRVDPGLRAEMVARGFEVGVHGLVHDGHLFRSRRIFDKRRPKINGYLKEWNAVGFRSPSTRRNLKWIGELDITYDSSTFDTDPFEPESDGAGTIFPFIIDPGAPAKPYVELPYTLPQDSTLFIILGEDSPRIWKEKLDWIAAKGGMVLINTHPDYMAFPSQSHQGGSYPVRFYQEFLEYVIARYDRRYWHVLPRDVSQWAATAVTTATRVRKHVSACDPSPEVSVSLKSKRALMIVFSVYPADPRVRRAAEALVDAGMAVDVICLREDDSPGRETVRGVRVYRIPLRRKRSQKGRYVFEYTTFGIVAFAMAGHLQLHRRYDVVHVHNMPDVLVFSALIPKLLGAKVILDFHDPMPEVFMAKYDTDTENRLIKTLLRLEKLSLRFAHLGITPNIAFRNLFIQRSCSPDKMQIVMNSPQENLFYPAENNPSSGQFAIMYHGTIVHRHGLDLAVEAVAGLRDRIPGLSFHVYGSGDAFVHDFLRLIDKKDVRDIVHYHGPQSLETIAYDIRRIDLGIIPNRRSAFTDLNFPTRIFEYLAVRKPVIAPRTPGILDYFDESSLLFFDPGDANSLAKVILRAFEDPSYRDAVLSRGRDVYAQHQWKAEKRHYCDMVARLCRHP